MKSRLKKREEGMQIMLDSVKIINGLYSLNLKHTHTQLLAILKNPSNIKLTRNFLSFIKQSLSSYLQAVDNLTNSSAGNEQTNSSNVKFKKYTPSSEILKELQRGEDLVMHVLKLIENSCELCNEEFQNFFRFQVTNTHTQSKLTYRMRYIFVMLYYGLF